MKTKTYKVPYRATYSGYTYVIANSAQEAEDMVNAGDFDEQPGAERVDWEACGAAREDK